MKKLLMFLSFALIGGNVLPAVPQQSMRLDDCEQWIQQLNYVCDCELESTHLSNSFAAKQSLLRGLNLYLNERKQALETTMDTHAAQEKNRERDKQIQICLNKIKAIDGALARFNASVLQIAEQFCVTPHQLLLSN